MKPRIPPWRPPSTPSSTAAAAALEPHAARRALAGALAAGEPTIDADKLQLTAVRRRVLGLFEHAGRPVKALDAVAAIKAAGEPLLHKTTVFRTIDVLVAAGLLRRIAGLAAYIACDETTAPPAALYICEGCQSVQGVPVHTANPPDAFEVAWSVDEHYGRCAACSA